MTDTNDTTTAAPRLTRWDLNELVSLARESATTDEERETIDRAMLVLKAPVDPVVVEVTLPEALSNEDGEVYWLEGHHSPAAAVLATIVTAMVDVDVDEAVQLLVGGQNRAPGDYERQRTHVRELLNSTRHVWLKDDPDNDENMLAAVEGEFGAVAYTRVDVRP